MRRLCFVCMIGVWFGPCAAALADDAGHKTGFIHKTLTDSKGEKAPYVVFIPHKYDGKKPYPVILFLHGVGEKKPVPWGLGTYVHKHEKTFDFIAVFPHIEGKGSWDPAATGGKHALQALDEVMKVYRTDPTRVYLTGFSMGGFGTWDMGSKKADRWAAIVPVAGGGKIEWVAALKDVPVWAFHGSADHSMPVEKTRELVAELKRIGGHVKYTEAPGVGHTPEHAYNTKELYHWLKQQHKP